LPSHRGAGLGNAGAGPGCAGPWRPGVGTVISGVLGPDGRAVIDDIRHFGEYAKAFGEEGFDVKRSGSRIVSAFLAILTFGSLRPATLIATRSAPAPGR